MHYLQQEFYDRIKTDDAIFEFLQQSSLDGLWFWDLTEQDPGWVSPRFWETLGYDPAEDFKSLPAWQDIINPEDLQSAITLVGKHLADPAVPYDQVVRYNHKEGHTVWIRSRGMALRDADGTPIRLIGAHVNVSAEKEQELLLERSQKIARIGSWEVDVANQKIHWDRQTRLIHEMPENFTPSIDQGINFYKEGKSRETIEKLFGRAVQSGKPYDVELQITTANNRDIWVRSIGQAEMLNGKCRRVFGIFQDIDARKRNEERLLNYSILEAKAKEMEQFAYVASHDLREPLLTIKGFLEVIREDFGDQLPAEVNGYLETISGATERMDELMKGLLDYSRLSQVKKIQEVNLENMLSEVKSDLSGRIRQTAATIEYEKLPAVKGYPLELKLLFQNLLANAIRYHRNGVPPAIKISYTHLEDGWHFKVSDNGIGIDEGQLTNIFQLYRQLHDKGRSEGYGIGLASCKKIVELHGGDIWARSPSGAGSVFHFTLKTKES